MAVSLLCSSSVSAFLLLAIFGSWVTQLRGVQTKQLAMQGSPDLIPQYEAGLSPRSQVFWGNPRLSKSPGCGTKIGTGPAPWSWSTTAPAPHRNSAGSGPWLVLGAVVEMGTAEWAALEADSQKELNLAFLNHPAKEMAALWLQKELERKKLFLCESSSPKSHKVCFRA